MNQIYVTPQKPNTGLSFLGFTGGALALLLIGMILLPVVIMILCCVGGIFGIAVSPDPSPTATLSPSPTATP